MASTADDTRQSPPLGSPSQGSVDGVDPYSDHAARILDSADATALSAAARTDRDQTMPLGGLRRCAVRGSRPADIVLADRKLTITWQEPIHISEARAPGRGKSGPHRHQRMLPAVRCLSHTAIRFACCFP